MGDRALGKRPLKTEREDGSAVGHRQQVARVGVRQGGGTGAGLVGCGYRGYGG